MGLGGLWLGNVISAIISGEIISYIEITWESDVRYQRATQPFSFWLNLLIEFFVGVVAISSTFPKDLYKD
ncbi:hypothetical protein DC094_18270 [Pelagibaculum spongiae]|uniref:Uncharacterized protein n=1 Tax=Pelagibaculum spongiae TaxID=2080658 RepID=A0A2V1GQF5_9GAMM|nr:hypothetical protein DC094_18270 [Pelagibaculum spongiae]